MMPVRPCLRGGVVLAIALAAVVGCDDPLAPGGADAYVDVAAGFEHTCATGTDDVTYCWGRAQMNQLGNLSEELPCLADASACVRPLPVLGEPGFRDLTLGRYHSCGLLGSEPFCWGYNQRGQLGDAGETITRCYGSDPLPCALQPIRVALGYGVVDIDAGPEHTCAVTRGGDVYCWGLNEHGQLGVGHRDNSAVPLLVPRPVGQHFVAVAAAQSHTCAITRDGSGFCWGANPDGELGDGTRDDSLTPVRVAGDANFVAIDAAIGHVCAIDTAGAVFCWGFWGEGRLGGGQIEASRTAPYDIRVPEPVVDISTGERHTCAAAADGTLYCWGGNAAGQLGHDAGPAVWVPTETPFPGGVRRVAAGTAHTCALGRDGSLACWGANDWGQLGTGDRDPSHTPVPVS